MGTVQITKEMLDTLPASVGQNIVVYDAKTRKAFFFIKNRNSYRLKMALNKRQKKIEVRPDDCTCRLKPNGILELDRTADVFTKDFA